jgi:hypothetical protein
LRLILDTNVLIAALITHGTPPDRLYEAWRDGWFTLITGALQIEEIRRVIPKALGIDSARGIPRAAGL